MAYLLVALVIMSPLIGTVLGITFFEWVERKQRDYLLKTSPLYEGPRELVPNGGRFGNIQLIPFPGGCMSYIVIDGDKP